MVLKYVSVVCINILKALNNAINWGGNIPPQKKIKKNKKTP